ncbi:MAG: hypothetical protein U5J63_13760 [Fodinibius sp.]|nr:hypothetical protein [Fodinibius sp.]
MPTAEDGWPMVGQSCPDVIYGMPSRLDSTFTASRYQPFSSSEQNAAVFVQQAAPPIR